VENAVSHAVCVHVGGPKKIWEQGVADPIEICSSTMCHLAKLIKSFWVEQYDHNYSDPPEKFDPSHSTVEDHSQKLTQIDWLPAISH